MDPLADVLRVSRVRGAVLARVVGGAPWGINLAASPGAMLHAVTAGTCWLRLGADPPLRLLPGDVVLLPRGSRHVLAGDPHGPTEPLDRATKRARLDPDGNLVLGGGGSRSQLLC